jgi:hypothetical protein
VRVENGYQAPIRQSSPTTMLCVTMKTGSPSKGAVLTSAQLDRYHLTSPEQASAPDRCGDTHHGRSRIRPAEYGRGPETARREP